MINASLKVIAWNGRIVVVGFAGGDIEKVPTNLLLLKNVEVTGVHWGAYQKNQPEMTMTVWAELLQMFEEKKIKGVVFDTVF